LQSEFLIAVGLFEGVNDELEKALFVLSDGLEGRFALSGGVEIVKEFDGDSVKIILVDLLVDLELDRDFFTKRVSSWSVDVEIGGMFGLVGANCIVFNIQWNVKEVVGHLWDVSVNWEINWLQIVSSDSSEVTSESASWLVWPVSSISHLNSGEGGLARIANNSFCWSRDKLSSVDSPRFVVMRTVVPVLATVAPLLTLVVIHPVLSSIWSATVLEKSFHMLLEAIELIL
jgi:hypothetical protein